MKLKAVLIDDEKINLENLEQLLMQHCSCVAVAGTARSADEGLQAILQYQPDIVFLDIQMPGKSGFDLLRSLPACSFEIIFVTAYDQYGIQAVKFAAVDYLLKPLNTHELIRAVETAAKRVAGKKRNVELENLVHFLHHRQYKEEHRLALSTLKETRFVSPSAIVCCESSNNYTTFHLSGEEKIIVSKPIYEYEELLKEYGFVRCHQSFLVNVKQIRSWVRDKGDMLLLTTNMQVPVAKSKKELLLQKLKSG